MKDNYEIIPQKSILPYDGMSINASVWSEAHGYHSLTQNAHQYFLHGNGIVTGLEVVASDPPDSIIFILPGVAVDNVGKMVVITEPVAYDLGEKIFGDLRLLLLHREVKVQAKKTDESNVPAYMQDEFVIAARTDILDVPYVELARINRESASSPVSDAEDPLAPGLNTIDLRFRENICPPPPEQIMSGVCYLGSVPEKIYDRALLNLVKPLSDNAPYRLIVENNIPLSQEIFNFQFLYLIATKAAKLTKKQAETLQTYLQNGGKILVEFCERVEDEQIGTLLKPAGVEMTEVPSSHPAFQDPYLFFSPPQGSIAKEKNTIWYGEPGVFSTASGYGGILSGEVQQSSLSRSVIRDAVEWGANILNYLLSN